MRHPYPICWQADGSKDVHCVTRGLGEAHHYWPHVFFESKRLPMEEFIDHVRRARKDALRQYWRYLGAA